MLCPDHNYQRPHRCFSINRLPSNSGTSSSRLVCMPSKKPFALAVDDEPADLDNVRHVLANAGYHVLTASDAKSAIEIFQDHADHIEILVTDVAMSPVGGCDLAPALVKLKPDLHVTFVSAYSGSL